MVYEYDHMTFKLKNYYMNDYVGSSGTYSRRCLRLLLLHSLEIFIVDIKQMAPMRVQNARDVPEYEIDPKELDFTNSIDITKVPNE